MLVVELEGIKVELQSSDLIEVLTFHEGTVKATIGEKNGAVAAPILIYEITGPKSLLIDGAFRISWEDIELDSDHIRVRRNGEPAVYNVSRDPTEE